MSSRPTPAPPFRRACRPCALAGLVAGLGLAAFGQSEGSGGFSRRESMPGGDQTMRIDPVLIFFPPNPPPLGRTVARGAPGPGRLVAPPELARFVNEVFYPPLGTRLATNSLSAKQRLQLDQYRAAKVALQAELRAELDRGRGLDPEERRRGLDALARRQAPRLAEIEASAEQLRRDLIAGDQTWGALRQWRLGDNDRRGFSPVEIAQVMRSYAFYQNGLLPAQRRLLREIAMELSMAGENAETATANQPYLFFPPEPARVLLPDDLPADLAARLASYQTKKSQLKKQLYDAVYAYDGQRLGFLRPNALKALAEKQAAALGELETLAEEIRRRLAEVVEPTSIAERTPLPPVLQHRVATLMASYATLQSETAARIEAILTETRGLPMQVSYRFEGDGLKYVVVPTRGARGGGQGGNPGEALARISEVRTRFGEIADEYGRRTAELINQKDALRTDVAQALGTSKAATIDAALLTAMRVVTARETEHSYREYRIAVFQPGLSPAQRRLLFDGVLEQLELPLPRGEFQPIGRASSW